MIFSNPSEYAIRALSELVLASADPANANARKPGYVMLDKLVENGSLPREFLAKIFRQLVEARVLASAKGPGGGFALARSPDEISLLDIIEAVDGSSRTEGCVVGLARCDDTMPCPQHDLFKPVRHRLKTYLSTTTLADTALSLKEKRTLAGKPDKPDKR